MLRTRTNPRRGHPCAFARSAPPPSRRSPRPRSSPCPVRRSPSRSAGAADGPGSLSHFDLARKDCLGTARNTTSKIWYTVANGVLSDVYAPTIDTTNVETMQYLVTDGSTFTDLQSRDTTYRTSTDRTGMMCTVTSTAKSGRYKLITTYLTDPARDSVVVHTRYEAADGRRARLPALRASGRDRRRQRRRRRRQRRRRLRDRRPLDRLGRPGLLRHRRRRPTPSTATTRCRPTSRCAPAPAVQPVSSGFVGTAERRTHPTRRAPTASAR